LHFNGRKQEDSFPLFSYSSYSENSIGNNRLTLIDILAIDKNSRLTLTKKFKKITSLKPNDNLIVYQDQYNKNIILMVQQDEKIVDNWVLKRSKDKIIRNQQVRAEDSTTDSANNIDNKPQNKIMEKEDSIGYLLQSKESTLYRLPILLVDDDEDLLSTFALFLKYEGYKNIKVFSDSRNVLKYFSDLKDPSAFKLAIIDIRMPKINGLQLCQILKILNPYLHIMIITSLDAVDEVISIYPDIKPTDIIRKPVDENQFIKAVNIKIAEIGTI